MCSVAQSCLSLLDPTDCSLSGFSVHGISQSRILKCLPFPPLGDLPNPGTEPISPMSPVFQADSLSLSHWGCLYIYIYISPL